MGAERRRGGGARGARPVEAGRGAPGIAGYRGDGSEMSMVGRRGGSERGARMAGGRRRAAAVACGLLCVSPLLSLPLRGAPAAGEAEIPPAAQEPVVRFAPGDVVEYSFAQYSRHRSGAGNDQVSEERTVEGTLTFHILEAGKDAGYRLAVMSDLNDRFVRKTPETGDAGEAVRGRRIDVTIIRLTRELRRAEGYEFGRAPVLGSSSRDVPDGGPPPVCVPILFPPLKMADASRVEEPWQDEIEALAPFGGVQGGRAQHGVQVYKNRMGIISFVRAIEGEPTKYIEKFLLNTEARTLMNCEFLHHTCGSGGNSRQETRAFEKSRRRLGRAELAAEAAAANEIEAVAKLLKEKPDEGRVRLAKLKEELRVSPFLPAIKAAMGEQTPPKPMGKPAAGEE